MKIGLSLQINSANNETTNRVKKIHSDQYPRRLALKFCQRRLLSGESPIACPVGGAANPIGETAVSGGLIPARASTSNLPRLEVDARIDPCVGEIGYQVHEHADERENIQRGEHHRIVAIQDTLKAEQPQAIERENGFDEQRTGKERVHERGWKAGDHDQHGVAKNVAIEHLFACAALGARRQHILFPDFLEK